MTPEILDYYNSLGERIDDIRALIKVLDRRLSKEERRVDGLTSIVIEVIDLTSAGRYESVCRTFKVEPFVLEAFRDAAMDHLKVLEAAFESDATPTNLKS